VIVWATILAITVIVQRQRKETSRMKEKWNEMKKRDEKGGREPEGDEE
jgi:hypothetical protein